jgi:hypothetical protein
MSFQVPAGQQGPLTLKVTMVSNPGVFDLIHITAQG